MIRICQLQNKMVDLKRDCANCKDRANCKNPDGPDMKSNRQRYQVIIK